MQRRAKQKILLVSGVMLFILGMIGVNLYRSGFEYIYSPSNDRVINPGGSPQAATIKSDESKVTLEMLALGEQTYMEKTFGNEVFLSDILGEFDGPFTIPHVMKAITKLGGRGTTNLQVEAAKSAKIGDVIIKKGELIDTGLDVPKGVYAPLGVKVKREEGRWKAGVTCMACHATVDPASGQILQGIPNRDLNIGYLLALGTNTSAYFTRTNITSLKKYLSQLSKPVTTSEGKQDLLPDPNKLEDEVDRQIMAWPKGSVDVTLDKENNPVQIPDALTTGDHPFGWSGQGIVGPFKGASAGINNVHAQNLDTVSQTEVIKPMYGIDKEVYLGTILQRAANPKYRYQSGEQKPSDFFAEVDPTPGVPGVNQLYRTAIFPKANYFSSIGLTYSTPGFHVMEELNAMAAWMETLKYPPSPYKADTQIADQGRDVFERAGCIKCHAGDYLSSNQVVPVEMVRTEPSRAKGFHLVERIIGPAITYAGDTPIPVPSDAKKVKIPMTLKQQQQLRIAWAHAGSQGGYKTMSLLGLAWSAPYLHDGGVAVGKERSVVGLPHTLQQGQEADPYHSLLAIIDRDLREKVIASNRSSKGLRSAHVTGEGHEYWVDRHSGFTREEQEALIRYLLSLPSQSSDMRQGAR